MTATNRHLSLFHRPLRLRRTASLRLMVQETQLMVNDLIYPLFVMEGDNQQQEIPSMPEIYRYSLDLLLKEIADATNLGINAHREADLCEIALFPLIPSDKKDNAGTESYNSDGLVQRTIKAIKQEISDLTVISDVALEPFSTYGHDGIVRDGKILNDETVEVLVKQAVSQAEAGADLILTYFAKQVALMLP